MSQTVLHLIGFFVGFAAAELTVAHAGPMAFFGIPFTKRLMREGAVEDGRDILKAYRGVVLVLGGVYAVSFAAVLFLFPGILPGFVAGSIVLILIRFRGWGYTLRNFDDYMTSNAAFLKTEEAAQAAKKKRPALKKGR